MPPRMVASLFRFYRLDKDGIFYPHLYQPDIDKLKWVIGKIEESDDDDMADFAVTLQRVLDWISAESAIASQSVSMVAERNDDGSVSVHNMQTDVVGTGTNVVVATYDCAAKMMQMFDDLENMDPDELDTLDWAKMLLHWADQFPVLQEGQAE